MTTNIVMATAKRTASTDKARAAVSKRVSSLSAMATEGVGKTVMNAVRERGRRKRGEGEGGEREERGGSKQMGLYVGGEPTASLQVF